MKKFSTLETAKKYMASHVDIPVKNRIIHLKKDVMLSMSLNWIDEDNFTNSYDVQYDPAVVTSSTSLTAERKSLNDIVRIDRNCIAVLSGGFSYLTDDPGVHPRHLSLNLAIENGLVKSLPVVDREALMMIDGRMFACVIRAVGIMEINGKQLSWSGSLTNHHTDIKLYGNGNSIITHVSDKNGSRRVLNDDSRFTPPIYGTEEIDAGFMSQKNGTFVASSVSTTGRLDIFAFDIVLRCPKHLITNNIKMRVLTIDTLTVGASIQSAVSAGPLLETTNFDNHSINKDASLGTSAPFTNSRAARAVLYVEENGLAHLRIFDGRPGSSIFPGVTPTEAVHIINSEAKVAWGCFLDGGQTAKLFVRRGLAVNSFGNRHYVDKVPNGQGVVWVPKTGRPLSSVISLN